MQLNQKSFRHALCVLLTIFALATVSAAQGLADQSVLSKIKIKNFGQMDDRFYRGAQPREEDYRDLAALGIKTIIDLRDDPKEYERPMAEALGMRYVNIPMVSKKYPTEAAIRDFLKVVNDPATGKFYVHCAGGRHRTGAVGAVYRYQFYQWNFDQVYQEMKKYDFYTSWGHGAFKDFVQDYYRHIQTAQAQAATTTTTTNTPVRTAREPVTANVGSVQVSDSLKDKR
ncbi:MAG TPA: tyrosine-protein phosphatase [Pyrinomonadaceae bacterium]